MENQKVMSLDDKLQKLINGYKELKIKYSELVKNKEEVDNQNNGLRDDLANRNQKIDELNALVENQKYEIENLKQENYDLRQKLEKYESKTQDAVSKIDDILTQIDEL